MEKKTDAQTILTNSYYLQSTYSFISFLNYFSPSKMCHELHIRSWLKFVKFSALKEEGYGMIPPWFKDWIQCVPFISFSGKDLECIHFFFFSFKSTVHDSTLRTEANKSRVLSDNKKYDNILVAPFLKTCPICKINKNVQFQGSVGQK